MIFWDAAMADAIRWRLRLFAAPSARQIRLRSAPIALCAIRRLFLIVLIYEAM